MSICERNVITVEVEGETVDSVVMCTALIFGVLCAALICGVLLNTETILLLIRQDPQVAKYADNMCHLLQNIHSLIFQYNIIVL